MDKPKNSSGPKASGLRGGSSQAAPVLACALMLLALSTVGLKADGWSAEFFNTNDGWERNDSLAYQVKGEPETGQNYNDSVANQWYTDDPYNAGLDVGATSILRHITNYTLGTAGEGYNSVLFGGYGLADGIEPGTANPSLFRSFNLLPDTESVTFSADFGLINSTLDFPNQDRFGFNLLDSTGTISLAQFVFDPAASSGGGLGMLWISDGTTNNIADISYASLYRMSVTMEGASFDLTMSSLETQTNNTGAITNYLVTNSFLLVSGGAIANSLAATDFQTVAMNWQLFSEDSAEPGDNYMLVNNVSVVPEPSTYALLVMAALGAVYWARRRRCW